MFTQKCFIRKKSTTIIDGLRYINAKICGCTALSHFVTFRNGEVHGIDNTDGSGESCLAQLVHDDPDFIDCGTNEKLFLAIAALRDDSDIYQWFTDGEKWVISDVHSLMGLKGYFDKIGFNYPATRKATIEELISHYSNESN